MSDTAEHRGRNEVPAPARRRAGTWPSIDHSLLSPSGRMSDRARKAAMKREAAKLFDGVNTSPRLPPQPTKRERLLREAAQCRDFAARGMRPRAFIKQAELCERLAAAEPSS